MFTFVSFKNTRAVTPYIEIIIVSVYIDEGLHAASQYIQIVHSSVQSSQV